MFESRENVRFSEISYGSVNGCIAFAFQSYRKNHPTITLLPPLEMERFLLFSAKRTGTHAFFLAVLAAPQSEPVSPVPAVKRRFRRSSAKSDSIDFRTIE